ncbi:MAG: 3-hydroxyacyl-CoA dehydrogenase NAD-binding domain-containing protein [Thermomicrobiales bacterium]
MNQIGKVAVIGAGTMGAQIASLAAISGYTVSLWDALDTALERGMDRAESEILPNIGAQRGLGTTEVASGLGRLTTAGSMAEAVDGAQLVIEAVREEIEVKRAVFSELSRMTDAILGTNSSSIPSSSIAPAVERPERLLNMHFFAPIWVRSMLELMSCGATSDETIQTARDSEFRLALSLRSSTVKARASSSIASGERSSGNRWRWSTRE